MAFDEEMMKLALVEAEKAGRENEVPVGSVIVMNDKVIACGHNTRESENNPLGHAECNAILSACKSINSRRLTGGTIYVTLEPCPMCAGAIINAGIDRVVYSASDLESGSFGSVIDLSKVTSYHTPRIKKGVLENESSTLLSNFFKKLRK